MEEKRINSRRKFLQKALAGSMMVAVSPKVFSEELVKKPTILPASAKGSNDRLRVAILGVHGRGGSQIQQIMEISNKSNVEIALLCDPDLVVLKERADEYEKKYGRKVATLQDFRRALEDKSIDAVTIATPNHWHALMTIWACQAGKDVYVEKPGTHNVHEGRKMIEAAYKYNRIVQHEYSCAAP
jgi:predicted dehydrogenase